MDTLRTKGCPGLPECCVLALIPSNSAQPAGSASPLHHFCFPSPEFLLCWPLPLTFSDVPCFSQSLLWDLLHLDARIALFVCLSCLQERVELFSVLGPGNIFILFFVIEFGKGFKIKILLFFSFWEPSFIFWASCSFFRGRATWARSSQALTKPSLPWAQSPVFILQQLEAYRLLCRQVNTSD